MVLDTDDDDNEDNSGQIHKVRCNSCNSSTIKSDRYKCLNCKDLNLCGSCFERRAESNSHKSGHVYVHFKIPGELFGKSIKEDDVTYDKLKKAYADEVHQSITCDGCQIDAIKGLRFKCDSCPNYDLCQQCVDKNVTTKTHQSTHPLIVTIGSRIQQIPVEDLEIGQEIGSGAFGRFSTRAIIYFIVHLLLLNIGSVHKGTWKSRKRPVACKVIKRESIRPSSTMPYMEALDKNFFIYFSFSSCSASSKTSESKFLAILVKSIEKLVLLYL